MKAAVVYHRADWDGLLSNEVCKFFLPNTFEKVDSYGWDYGLPVPKELPGDYDSIFIVDLSVPELMDRPRIPNRVVWIDHHLSAIEKYDLLTDDDPFAGLRVDGVGACRLCWHYFSRENGERWSAPTKTDFFERRIVEPRLIRLAGEYDVFDHRDPDAITLQYGLTAITDQEFGYLIQQQFGVFLPPEVPRMNYLEVALSAGHNARRYQEKTDAMLVKQFSGDVFFEGLKFLAANGVKGSLAFTAALRPDHDALMAWRYSAESGKVVVSLYNPPGKDHDLAAIAKRYGGGGHRGACGFRVSIESMAYILASKNLPLA